MNGCVKQRSCDSRAFSGFTLTLSLSKTYHMTLRLCSDWNQMCVCVSDVNVFGSLWNF